MAVISGFHLDTDFLVYALSERGPERIRLSELASSLSQIHMSSLAWYEFSRGPRTPEQLAVARSFLSDVGVLPLTEEIAVRAADVFRSLGSPRNRTGDIVIGVTALLAGATLLTRNRRDFAAIPGLRLDP